MAKYKGIWPPPVYVGEFADGETVRFTFGSTRGKPMDFAAGRRAICHAWREGAFPAGRKSVPCVCSNGEAARGGRCTRCWGTGEIESYPIKADGSRWTFDDYYAAPLRTDLVGGYVEWDGQTLPDPMFNAAAAEPVAKAAKPSALDKLIASLSKLPPADMARVREVVNGW